MRVELWASGTMSGLQSRMILQELGVSCCGRGWQESWGVFEEDTFVFERYLKDIKQWFVFVHIWILPIIWWATLQSFHRLPLLDRDTLRLWLEVLQMDKNTPIRTLCLAVHRVCGDYFDPDDFCQRKKNPKNPKHVFLKKNAVLRVERPTSTTYKRINIHYL